MKQAMVTSVFVLAGLSLLAGAPSGRAEAHENGKAVVSPAGDLKWVDTPAVPGAKMATLWGDPTKGAYGALKKIPGGAVLKPHTHTQNQKVIVLSGTILLSIGGEAAQQLDQGSYAFIPGGTKHKAECKAGADCIYFEEQPGASDIKFVESHTPPE